MKSKTMLIIEALKSGRALNIAQLQDYLTNKTREKVTVNSFSTILTKISKPEKSDLGHLVKRRKIAKYPYQYNIVDEALKMTTEELYDLSTKRRKNRFTLDQALRKYPGIRKYVKGWELIIQEDENTELPEKTPRPVNESSVDKRQEAFVQVITALLSKLLSPGMVINVNLNIRIEM